LRITDGEELNPEAALTVAPEWQYNPGKSFWQPNTKKYTGWESKKVEQIVAKANEFKNNVEFVKNVDYNNEREVSSALREQEKTFVSQDFESAVVVTKTGEVFKANETEYSFSKEDFELFRDGALKVLRGADDKFYELTRLNDVVDGDEDPLVKIIDFENYRHSCVLALAKQSGFGYKRKKR